MTSNLQSLQSLLHDISDLGTVAEDQDVNRIAGFDPLLEQARSLGVAVQAPTTLGRLRQAVEAACAAEARESAASPGHELAAHVLANPAGIPGDGP